MKRIILCSVFFLSYPLHSADNGYGYCGAKPGALESFFTQAEKIREKCISDIYEAEKKKTQKEIQDLYAANKAIDAELKKVAYKIEYSMVHCNSPRGGTPNSAREKKCNELVQAKTHVVSRIHKLMGWEARPIPKAHENVSMEKMEAPCPSQAELNRMKPVRYYNRKLYTTWERCVVLAP